MDNHSNDKKVTSFNDLAEKTIGNSWTPEDAMMQYCLKKMQERGVKVDESNENEKKYIICKWLTDILCENAIADQTKQDINSNVNNWLNYGHAPGKPAVVRIGFALKLGVEETDELLERLRLGKLSSRIIEDMIYIYCLNKSKSYSEACSLIKKYKDQYSAQLNEKSKNIEFDNDKTRHLYDDILKLKNDDELDYLIKNEINELIGYSSTQYKLFLRWLSYAKLIIVDCYKNQPERFDRLTNIINALNNNELAEYEIKLMDDRIRTTELEAISKKLKKVNIQNIWNLILNNVSPETNIMELVNETLPLVKKEVIEDKNKKKIKLDYEIALDERKKKDKEGIERKNKALKALEEEKDKIEKISSIDNPKFYLKKIEIVNISV